ncbi:MAG: hypothetical protein AAFV80_24005, partial [Bacteroidota bacterium]
QLMQQSFVREQEMIWGYSKSILLTNIDYNGSAQPTIKDEPTEEKFYNYIRELTMEGYYIDIIILTHGSRYGINLKKSKNYHSGDEDAWFHDGLVTPRDLTNYFCPRFGYRKTPIRMVFQSNCWGSNMMQAWQDIGAKAVCGTRYVNYHAGTIIGFLPMWKDGQGFKKSVETGVDLSNEGTYVVINTIAETQASKWRTNCKTTNIFKDKGGCVYKCYDKIYGHDKEQWFWDQTGRSNIDSSSKFFFLGDRNITYQDKPTW